jgi:putative N6-adenine-specific DNA methylase
MSKLVKPEKSKILITCSRGVGPYLKKEVEGLGYSVTSETASGVETLGALDDAMKFNLHIRTGQRVLLLLNEFRIKDIQDFYRKVKNIRWEDHIHEDGYICVTSAVDSPLINNSRYANQKCKDAIVDRIKEERGSRPDSGPEKDRIVIFIHWKGNKCSVYLDTSGEPLFKRGYREISLTAPMQETLAAAVVSATDWDGRSSFINPMCGSGTLAIEAALKASDKAPGITRNNFGFMHLKGFDKVMWNKLRSHAEKRSKTSLPHKIIASDKSHQAIKAAKSNAARAGVTNLIDFRVCDYADTPVSVIPGIVMMNPEYGERMGTLSKLEETYRGMGDFLKQKCSGYKGYIFTGNLGLAKKIGLRTSQRITFYSGKIECRLLEYDLYEGSRKRAKSSR